MARLLTVLAAEPLAFKERLAARHGWPRFSDDRLHEWTAAVHGLDGKWHIRTGETAQGQETLVSSLAGTPPSTALVARMCGRSDIVSAARGAPCHRDGWMFAYDGTVEDLGYLESRTSERRQVSRANAYGERLLAFVLTRLDECTSRRPASPDSVDEVLANAASELARRVGTLSFVLSDGTTLFAYRFDRSLYFLDRGPTDAVLVASEPITAEAWLPLAARTLVRGRRNARLDVRFLIGQDPRDRVTDVELPFTD